MLQILLIGNQLVIAICICQQLLLTVFCLKRNPRNTQGLLYVLPNKVVISVYQNSYEVHESLDKS